MMELKYEMEDCQGGSKVPVDAWRKARLFVPFEQVALMADENDNVAIATTGLKKGTLVRKGQVDLMISHDVVHGHRFAVREIGIGQKLLSWGQPFAEATVDIHPGMYVCNKKVLTVLRERCPTLVLPEICNFRDFIAPYSLEEGVMDVGVGHDEGFEATLGEEYFSGYKRKGGRGVGTRNYVIVLGVSCSCSTFVRKVAKSLDAEKDTLFEFAVDGVVAVAHTESGLGNNAELVKRTLAGCIIHPNIAGALIVSFDDDCFGAYDLENYMRSDEQYRGKLDGTPHLFLEVEGHSFQEDFRMTREKFQENLLPCLCNDEREERPLSDLCVALQCGGSDAFSGITGNPLVGAVSQCLVRANGRVVLAETDELIGAESYVLRRVKSVDVAKKFLLQIERIRELLSWHGLTAEGNPSAGNMYRGLYNIAIKSLGAAMKKPAGVQLDHVIDYSQVASCGSGYYFMHSPGNDLESISGQVASGCNVIFFTTGNGSITNFPFVPTIKVVTTSERYQLLEKDMDFNAGKLCEAGQTMERLTLELVDLLVKTSSGQRTKGESAGHSQVSVWRNWMQTSTQTLARFHERYGGNEFWAKSPLRIIPQPIFEEYSEVDFDVSYLRGSLGLILPTSLCSSEIAGIVADRLNDEKRHVFVNHFVYLPHTEGCGSNYGSSVVHAGVDMLDRVLVGHLLHPHVAHAVLLEHGCEMNHNDRMIANLRGRTSESHVAKFGRASVQVDGGIEASVKVCLDFFDSVQPACPTSPKEVGAPLRLGVVTQTCDAKKRLVSNATLTVITKLVVSRGGVVVIPETSSVGIVERLSETKPRPSLAFGESISKDERQVVHIMETPTQDWLELITGLASTGVDLIIAFCDKPRVAHMFVPVVQVGFHENRRVSDLDVVLDTSSDCTGTLVETISNVLKHGKTKAMQNQHTGFQIARGHIGVSV
mmetsp:Transcript_23514/g.51076  ORF Transcript_23514/g.51076 Transcript_23514/m.51076 type:complete len:935 (-) Transcript_23514:2215-5019(-)